MELGLDGRVALVTPSSKGIGRAPLHWAKPAHGEAATLRRAQIAKANSSNATASRRITGSPTASS